MLDKIELDMEIADPLRDLSSSSNNSSNLNNNLFDSDSGGSYGFIDKCIDAIQLNIDSITVTIKSSKFTANLNVISLFCLSQTRYFIIEELIVSSFSLFKMSNIFVYSVTPNWKVTNDIRTTRLKDLDKEEIILFKEISWEICRFEMYNIQDNSSSNSTNNANSAQTSIKLIMNPSKIQIALKKKLSDKSLICSTFKVLLNEIYWMANDTQLKSAIGTYNLITKLMKKAFIQRRKDMMYENKSSQQQTNNTNVRYFSKFQNKN
jgi:hypothetical protein